MNNLPAEPITVHPAHVLGILGTAVRRRYGDDVLKRGLDRLAVDVALAGPDPRATGERVWADLDSDE